MNFVFKTMDFVFKTMNVMQISQQKEGDPVLISCEEFQQWFLSVGRSYLVRLQILFLHFHFQIKR